MTYDRIEQAARLARMPQVQWQCQRARRNLEKGILGPSAEEKAPSARLRRMLLSRAEAQRNALLKKRAQALLGRRT